MVGETEVKERPKSNPDYLMQLMNDRKVMSSLPNFSGIFTHLERLLDEEIGRVRKDMYNDTLNGGMFTGREEELPEGVGPVAQLQEKLYVPVKEYPDFNFVGRILGPRGLTAKQLEAETGCKIMVRGKGSMRDKKKEEMNRGKPNWEHLSEDLHVLITVEDTHNRAKIKLQRAITEVKKLLVPAAEGEDNLKKMQLMELAILNGTYRDANLKTPTAAFPLAPPQAPRIIPGPAPVLPPLRNPAPVTTPIMPLIRQIQSSALVPGANPHAALVQQGPESGIIYAPYEYPYTLTPSILEYPIDSSGVLAGAVSAKVRRHEKRTHPYQRVTDRGQFGPRFTGVCSLCVDTCMQNRTITTAKKQRYMWAPGETGFKNWRFAETRLTFATVFMALKTMYEPTLAGQMKILLIIMWFVRIWGKDGGVLPKKKDAEFTDLEMGLDHRPFGCRVFAENGGNPFRKVPCMC